MATCPNSTRTPLDTIDDQATEAQSVLARISALASSIHLHLDNLGPIENTVQRNIMGHVTCITEVIESLSRTAGEICESIETACYHAQEGR